MSQGHPELQSQHRRAFSPSINFFSAQLPEFSPPGRRPGYVSELIVPDLILPPNAFASYGFVAETSALFTYTRGKRYAQRTIYPSSTASIPSALPSLGGRKFPTAPPALSNIPLRIPLSLQEEGALLCSCSKRRKCRLGSFLRRAAGPGEHTHTPKPRAGCCAPREHRCRGSAGGWVPEPGDGAAAPAREVPATSAKRLRSLAKRCKPPQQTTTTKSARQQPQQQNPHV